MRVSIYMPTKNRVELLRRAVDSVVRQTYADIELWVVDDGSTDGTAEYLQSISAADPRVHYIRNEQSLGAPRARNLAIKQASGMFVTGLDDDDSFHEQRIEKLVAEWQRLEASKTRFSCLYTQDFMQQGDHIEVSRKVASVAYEDLFFYNLIGNQIFTRRDWMIDAGLFDERMPAWQDLDMFMRVVERFGPARLVDAPLYTLELAPRNDRISVSKQRIEAAYQRLATKYAHVKPVLRQGLFLQRFGKLYGFKMSARDLREFWRFGVHPRTLKRFCGIALRQLKNCDTSTDTKHAPNAQLRVLMFPKSATNPYLHVLVERLEQHGAQVEDFTFKRAFTERYDVLHIHWPDLHLKARSSWRGLLKQARLALVFMLFRLRRARVVWTVHNLKPHERHHALSETVFALWFPRLLTDVIAMTSCGLAAAREEYPPLRTKHSVVIPHGHYRDAYPPPIERHAARQRLGVPDRFTFMFFGNIRPYKNVPQLIDAFRSLSRDDVQLIIVGQPGGGVEVEQLRQRAAPDSRIHLKLEFVSEHDVPLYLGAADLVVLPFDSILNSGSVLLGLSFNRPVLAPRLGSLPEIQHRVSAAWLRLYEGALDAAHLEQGMSAARLDDSAPDLSSFDWDVISDLTIALYASRDAERHTLAAQQAPSLPGSPAK